MNIVNINDNSFKETNTYKEFIKNNPGNGILKIRASSASNAVPISNLRIIVSYTYNDTKIVFFDGLTDDSGMINGIILPTPISSSNDLIMPNNIIYDIEAIYKEENINNKYKVAMYSNIFVVQYINIVPTLKVSNMDVIDNGN